MSKGTMTKRNVIQYSPRRVVFLTKEEILSLKTFIEENSNTAYAEIKANTKIHRDTILKTLETGKCELRVAIRLRDFIKMIDNSKHISKD